MRQFLYYNQDSIDSLLAQIEQGLLLRKESDETHEETNSSTVGVQADITSDLSAKVLGIGASIKGNIQGTDSDTEIATRMIRSIQEKALHDYAFDKIHEYLASNNLIKNENYRIGDIILLSTLPTFLDFNYFLSLFAENGAVKFSNERTKKQMDEQLAILRQSIPKGQSMPEHIKVQIRSIESQVKKAEPERKEMVKTIEAIQNTLPYNRFVMTDSFLIPLADKYLRDDPDIVAFKYGGQMSILGYVTNAIDSNEEKEHFNDFAPLYDSINKMMLGLFKGKDKVYIVHPIALFY